MNWINNTLRPKIRGILGTRREVPDNTWEKCPETGQIVHRKELEENMFVFPGSNYHMQMSAESRLKSFFDDGIYELIPSPGVPIDPLRFRDERRYTDRLKDHKERSRLDDAVLSAEGRLDGLPVVASVQDFRFMGGSLGTAAGEAVVTAMERAVKKGLPFVMFAASGGARMQEGILSLMQMPRTTIAVRKLREIGLPYIVVLTHPTTGGVTASYAMLGDIHIAEPGALIGFAGPRVIEQTIREQLPEGFQRAEYLVEHGMVDLVVHRLKLRETIARICRVLMHGGGQLELPRGKSEQQQPQVPVKAKHVNGSAVDAKTAQTRAAKGIVIDAEAIEVQTSASGRRDKEPKTGRADKGQTRN